MATVVGAVVVSVALSYLANRFFAPEPPNPLVDDTPTTLSRRGAHIPRIWGTRRTGPVFAWAGNRRTEEKSSGGGGKGGSDSDAGGSTVTYFEKGWHAICIGPVFSIEQIRAGSTPLLSSPILEQDNPSGSNFNISGSNYRVYWGNCDQPPDPILSSGSGTRVGIASSWPWLCYVMWDDRKLGSAPNWPQLDYTVQTRPINSVLTGSNGWMDDGNGVTGWNPAHVLYEVLTAEFPHGANRKPHMLDINRFEQLGALMQSEFLAVNVISKDGLSCARLLADIFQDAGILMPQVGDALVPWPIRGSISPYAEVVPRFDQSNIEAPPPEIEIKYTDMTDADRIVFQFPSKDNRYRTFDLIVDDDSQTQDFKTRKDTPVNLPTITDFNIAAQVADRRQLELLSNTDVFKGKFDRQARLVSSGQRFIIAGVGTFRCLSNKPLMEDGACEMEYIVDAFSDPPTGFIPDAPNPEDQIPDRNESIPASDDVAFTFFEVPCTILQSNTPLIFGVRGRDNTNINGSNANVSFDNTTYNNIGSAGTNHNTGLLDEAIAFSDDVLIESGPLVTMETVDDIALIQDLSNNSPSWLSGSQICIINDEWFYLRNVVIVSGSQVRLEGLIRFRDGTQPAIHAISSRVWIFNRIDIAVLSGPIAIGQLLYYKSVPFTSTQVADITSIAPVSKNIVGLVFEPLTVTALRTANVDFDFRGNVYQENNNAFLKWNYRECGSGGGVLLGKQVSGTVINSTYFPSSGGFHYQILDEFDTVIREGDLPNDAQTFTYTNAQILDDFGTPPDLFKFQVKAWGPAMNRDSFYTQIIVTKDESPVQPPIILLNDDGNPVFNDDNSPVFVED